MNLLILNSCRRFTRNIIQHPIHVPYFINDSVGNLFQNRERNLCPVCSHKVSRLNGTKSYCVIVCSAVTHNAYASHVRKRCKVLVNLTVKTCVCNLFAENRISITENVKFFLRQIAYDANSKPRSRERLTVHHIVRQAERFSYNANLVLKKEFNRFYEFKLQILRQTSYIMMSLYTVTFKNVGVNCTLSQEFNTL